MKKTTAAKTAAKKSTKSTAKATKKSAPAKGKNTGKLASSPEDIIQLILRDHKPLKALIKVMKSEDAEYDEKKEAFEQFAPALVAHAKPEEQTWYISMKEEDDMVVEGLEGDVEHGLADQLCEELKRTDDEDMFMAKVKVLAELVEHHIEEEEEDMLPDYRKNSTLEERVELGLKYLELQADLDAKGDDDAPHEGYEKSNTQQRPAAMHARR